MACQGMDDLIDTYGYLTSERFYTNGRENPRFIYYFVSEPGQGLELDSLWLQKIQNVEAVESDLHKKVFVFIISLKDRGTTEFDNIESWSSQRFDPSYSFTGSLKPRGRFVGTTLEPASTLMIELRKHYGLVQF